MLKNDRLDTNLKIMTAIIAILTFGFSVYQYNLNYSRENEKPFLEAQRKLCHSVSEMSAGIAMHSGAGNVSQERVDKYFEIYYGIGRLYLDRSTIEAMGALGSRSVKCNKKLEENELCVQPVFNGLAMAVSDSCRSTVTTSWNRPLGPLDDKDPMIVP